MIKIVADSTCDLPMDIIEEYDLGIAPLMITIEGKDYQDKIDIQADEFYAMIEELEKHPTTAMPSPEKFVSIYEEAYNKGDKEILVICMSSETSGSHQSAVLAKNLFEEEHDYTDAKIYVVDSTCMSHGSGWLIMKSAMLREQGATFDELIEFNESYKTNVKHFLSVDDLDHLIRSGRLSSTSAMIGKLLKVKPIMSMRNKRGVIVAKERGRKKVLKHYVTEYNRRVDKSVSDFIIIGYTSDRMYAENLKLKLELETDFEGPIYIFQMGVAVGTHVGLGGLSMYFVEQDKMKDSLLHNELLNITARKDRLKDQLTNLSFPKRFPTIKMPHLPGKGESKNKQD